MKVVSTTVVAASRFFRFSRNKGAFTGMDVVKSRLTDKTEVATAAAAAGALARGRYGMSTKGGELLGGITVMCSLGALALGVVAVTGGDSAWTTPEATVLSVVGAAITLVLLVQGLAVAAFFRGRHLAILVNTTMGVGEALAGAIQDAGVSPQGPAPAQGPGVARSMRVSAVGSTIFGLGGAVLLGWSSYAALDAGGSDLAIVVAVLAAVAAFLSSLGTYARLLCITLLSAQAESISWFMDAADFGKDVDLATALREALELSTVAVRTVERAPRPLLNGSLCASGVALLAVLITQAVEVTEVSHAFAGGVAWVGVAGVVVCVNVALPFAAVNDKFATATAMARMRCSAALGATGASTAALIPVPVITRKSKYVGPAGIPAPVNPPASWFTFGHTADVLLLNDDEGLDMLEEGVGAEAMPKVQKEVNKALYVTSLGLGHAEPAYAVRVMGFKLSRSAVFLAALVALAGVGLVERLSAVV
eukprot:CAMPEP_0203823498 /NCGR_PEP_ID=MMETSP0115-20131106/49372_1 /ASSEMBLY_ACC=CAM_ASM_000227 /TAXON_ID=33651 /ORGANISM="Bicosoecid sp, Strain ms1" /LENGTH=477 /DNA_ID=CAMNT_0050732535 /DNA_START=6 /DNA_END=1436 /DNA_ORIENTATION=-